MAQFQASNQAQWPIVSVVEVTYQTEFEGTGQVAAIKLPVDAIITACYAVVDVQNDDTTAPTFDIGTAADQDAINGATAFDTGAAAGTVADYTAAARGLAAGDGGNIYLDIVQAPTGDGTEGRAFLVLEYVLPYRSNEVQTH